MRVLVLHDGELADVCELLADLGAPYTERRGGFRLPDVERTWDLVVAGPGRALRADRLVARPATRSIVIARHVSRTLERRLARLGVDLVVRRPVHPSALRLLLEHALYRGSERRRVVRVAVGTPVRVRTGWWTRRALLQDLSVRGARLRTRFRARPGASLSLRVPARGRLLVLDAQVVRAHRLPDGAFELGLTFLHREKELLPQLRELVAAHERGPAVWAGALPGRSRREERREQERRRFERRVIARGGDRPRVLLGRDLSLGGMRVEGQAGLWAGDRFQVALHVRPGQVPLVVEAEIVRDDARGVAMRFPELTPAEREELGKMLADLPALSAPDAAGGETRVLAERLD